MRLALIFNPFKYKIHEENIKIVQKYFGLFPPLSLAWVASIAERAGHKVTIIDARTLGLSQPQTLDILKKFKPDIIGFMMTTYMFPETLEWIKYLKGNLKVPVIVGGYNLRVYPKESVSHSEIDFGVLEHAYYTLPALLKEIERGGRNFDCAPGLVYKKNSEIIINPHIEKVDFDKFPNPARHLLPNELYAEFPTERKNFTVMVTSLGCPFRCSFCEAGGTSYNPRSPQTVVQEIEECYYKYGIREIDIFDYEFTGVRQRVSEICGLLREKKLDVSWACRSRVDTIDGELLQEMKRAGCARIYFGLESGVQDILNKVNKGITLRQIKERISVCKDLGIKTLGFFLIGSPGETTKSVKQTLDFAKKLNADYVQFSKCLAKPLTPLWKQMVTQTKKDYWKDWVLGNEIDKELVRPWTSLTNRQINKLTKWAYLSYYIRPLFLLRHIFKLRSLLEFKRKFFALFDMLVNQEVDPRQSCAFRIYNESLGKKSDNEDISDGCHRIYR